MDRLPHLKFLKTMIAHKLTFTEVSEELEKALLPPLASQDFKHILDDLYKSAADYFDSTNPKEFPPTELLRNNDILELFVFLYEMPISDINEIQHIHTSVPGALRILNDPQMRRAIQALSIAGNVPEEDIELIINGKYDITYISENFTLFMKYFFDIKDWSLAQKQDYVKKLHPSQRAFKEAYVYALQGDKNFLLWKLGLAPDKSFDQMLRDIMVDCYYNFKEQTGSNADSALKWGTLMAKVSDRLDKMEKEDEQKQTLYQQITFQLNQDKAYDKILSAKERQKKNIELPTLDTSQIPDISTLEKLAGNSNDDDFSG